MFIYKVQFLMLIENLFLMLHVQKIKSNQIKSTWWLQNVHKHWCNIINHKKNYTNACPSKIHYMQASSPIYYHNSQPTSHPKLIRITLFWRHKNFDPHFYKKNRKKFKRGLCLRKKNYFLFYFLIARSLTFTLFIFL